METFFVIVNTTHEVLSKSREISISGDKGNPRIKIKEHGRTSFLLSDLIFDSQLIDEFVKLKIKGYVRVYDELNNELSVAELNTYKYGIPPVKSTSGSMSLYVSNSRGNDLTGNGTPNNPYATITKSLSILPPTICHEVYIRIEAGTYTDFPRSIAHEFFKDGKLILDGTGNNYNVVAAGPFTINTIVDKEVYYGDPSVSEYTVSGATWVVNTYVSKFMHFLTGAAAGILYPIRSNSADTLKSFGNAHSIAPGDTFRIVDPPVIIQVDHPICFKGNSTSSIAASSGDSPGAPLLAMGGLKFEVSGSYENCIQFWNLRVLTTFVTILRTSEDNGNVNLINSMLNYDFALDFPVFDNAGSQTPFDIFMARSLAIGATFGIPRTDYRHVQVDNSSVRGVCGAFNIMVWSGDNVIIRSLVGSIECYNKCTLLLQNIYCSIVGYKALNLLQIAVEMGGVYIDATTWLDFSQGMTATINSLSGNTANITANYAVRISRFTQLWLPAPANVTLLGKVGAFEFTNGNKGKHVSWPAAADTKTDAAGSYVVT